MTETAMLCFSQYSLERITTLILVLVIVSFLFLRKRSQKHIQSIRLYFVFLLLYEAGHFVTYSVLAPLGAFGWYAVALGPVGLVFLLNGAYQYPLIIVEKERKVVTVLAFIAALGASIEYFYKAANAKIVLSETGYAPAYQSGPVIIIAVILLVWTIIVFARQARAANDKSRRRAALGMAFVVCVQMLITFPIALYTFFRSLPFVILVSFLNAAHLVLYSMFVFMLFAGKNEVRLYERLAGILLVMMLAGAGIASQVAFGQFEASYDAQHKLRIRNFFQQDDSIILKNMSGDAEYICRVNGSEIEPVWSRRGICPDSNTMLVSFTPGRWRFSSDRHVVPVSEAQLMKRYLVQTQGHNYYQYSYKSARGTVFVAGFSYFSYRQKAHAVGIRLMVMVLAGLAVVLMIIPALMRVESALTGRRKAGGVTKNEDVRSRSVPDNQRMDKALEYIAANYMYDISREGIASHVQMSPGRFGIAFLQYTGKKFGEYLNDIRIDRACELLRQSKMSVLDIAFASGFESMSTFSRAFLKKTGVSAREYRDQYSLEKSVNDEM